MDEKLKYIIKRNEKTREVLDGLSIDPEGISLFDILIEKPPIITVEPLNSERENRFKRDRKKEK